MKTFSNTVNGRTVTSDRTFESGDPATGEVLGLVPHEQAVAAARAAQPAWAALPDAERQAVLMKVAEVIKANSEYLAAWVTREQGKPLGGVGPDQVPGARFELWGCEVWTQVPASLPMTAEVVFEDDTRRDEVHRKPFGVVAAIAPWNWPLLIAIWQVISALRAGNTVVPKPSEYTSIGTAVPELSATAGQWPTSRVRPRDEPRRHCGNALQSIASLQLVSGAVAIVPGATGPVT